MNYRAHYDRLIERAKTRTLECYSEKHHIVPKCIGGDNSKDNIVKLTPEEHYTAHLLLVKMHPDNIGLLWAAVAMTNGTEKLPRRNKMYGWLRREFAERIGEHNKGQRRTKEARERMRLARLGKKLGPHSEETRRKMSEASSGKPKSQEHCAALSVARTGRKFGPHSEEHNAKIRQANIERSKTKDYSYLQDEDYKKGQSEKMREIWARRKAGLLEMPNYIGE